MIEPEAATAPKTTKIEVPDGSGVIIIGLADLEDTGNLGLLVRYRHTFSGDMMRDPGQRFLFSIGQGVIFMLKNDPTAVIRLGAEVAATMYIDKNFGSREKQLDLEFTETKGNA